MRARRWTGAGAREGGGDAQGRQGHASQRGHIARDRRDGDGSAGARARDAVSEGCGGEQGAESQEMAAETHRDVSGMPASAATSPETAVKTTDLQGARTRGAVSEEYGGEEGAESQEMEVRGGGWGAQVGQREPGQRADVRGEAVGDSPVCVHPSAAHRRRVRIRKTMQHGGKEGLGGW